MSKVLKKQKYRSRLKKQFIYSKKTRLIGYNLVTHLRHLNKFFPGDLSSIVPEKTHWVRVHDGQDLLGRQCQGVAHFLNPHTGKERGVRDTVTFVCWSIHNDLKNTEKNSLFQIKSDNCHYTYERNFAHQKIQND